MAKAPIAPYTEFKGLVTNANPHNIPQGGAVKQTNLTILRQGELEVRAGLREVRFDN